MPLLSGCLGILNNLILMLMMKLKFLMIFPKEMEKLVEMGLVKSIGISNFTTKKVAELLEFAKIKPVCNQGTVCNFFVLCGFS